MERKIIGDEFSGESSVKWMGLDFDYHMLTYQFDRPLYMNYKASTHGSVVSRFQGAVQNFSGRIFYTKKEYDILKDRGDNLKLAVDFGFFGIVAIPIFRGLQFFYSYIPNYGISIIILTFLLRLFTYPLQLNSMKSMKKMQKVQPELKN